VFKNILLIAGVTLVCLLALEPLTRLFLDTGKLYEIEMWKYATRVKERDHRPDIGHRHRANAHAVLMGEDVRTDSHGFRGPDIADRAAPGVARIAFVGDSIMMGWGVAEQETMPAQVLAALQRQGRKVDGFNLGVGNYNTLQEFALFKDKGAQLKPDIIVLGYFINDAEPMPNYNDTDWMEENSEAWVTLGYRLDTLSRQFGERPDWKKYYRDLYEANAAGWKQTQKSLADFAQLAKEQGIKLVVFNIPEIRELKPYPFGDVTAKVRAVVEAQGMKFVDLLPSVENFDPSSLWVTVPDPHPNGKAEIAMSRQIVPELAPLLDELCRTRGKGCSGQ
jgi:lysophospholipase L1-like esterase